MNGERRLAAFEGCGIELEYMLVDRESLAVVPIADRLLLDEAGDVAAEVGRGPFAWSNELVMHLIEVKNRMPDPLLEPLAVGFQAEVRALDERLQPLGACLMPTAMHPWMDPRTETRLWPHEHALIYRTYDRIFDCARHGWANLQCMHVNLPFRDDGEFERLHAAVRLVLPIIPALAASSPFAEGRSSGYLDFRMEVYRTHPQKVPSLIGAVIPDTVCSRAGYEIQVLEPMYRAIEPLDPEGVLRHEWLNCRGAIARFDRSAIEIRVIDLQECPAADLAVAAAVVAAVKAMYGERWSDLSRQQSISTESLSAILLDCIREAERAVIRDARYLCLLGHGPESCEAGRLWRQLIDATLPQHGGELDAILNEGPLARRIVRAVGTGHIEPRLRAVYRELCECLRQGRMFHGLT